MGEVTVRLSAEGSSTEDKFVSAYAEGPPVDSVSVTAFGEDFWSHVGHGASDTREESPFGVMNSNVEICEMCMTLLV